MAEDIASCLRIPLSQIGLFHWSRTRDKDIHQPPGALLPVRAARYIRDADKRAKQVEWLEISTNVSTLNGALHQRINRPWIWPREPSYSFDGPPTSVFSAGAMMCLVAM